MKNYLTDLNKKQKEAVSVLNGPVLIVAGAGAGKTKTITCRIAHLIETGVSPEKILAVTFTNKAAREMRERVSGLGKSNSEIAERFKSGGFPFIGTFHALGIHIIKQNSVILGLPRFFSIYDKSDGKRIIKEALEKNNYDPKQFDSGKILNTISREKGNFVTAEEYAEQIGKEYFPQVVSRAWNFYEKKLTAEKALDLDDLLLVAAKLLQSNSEVRNYYQNLWQYIHVDEYQDTNTVQYQIVRWLSEIHKNICVVGDTDQNIYSWRGADIRNILRFEKDFKNTTVITLEENYRSTKTILAAANKVISKNKFRFDKKLFTNNASGDQIGLFETFSETNESFTVGLKVKELLESGVKADEIAILYRANFQSRVFEEAFISLGIPYALIGTKFFDRKEIKDSIAFIKAALNNQSWIDIERIINIPARGIGLVTVKKLKTGKKENLSDLTIKKVDRFYDLLNSIKKASELKSTSEVVKFVLKKTGLENSLKENNDENQERIENLMELVTIASRYDEAEPPHGLEAFLGDVALVSQEETPTDKPEAVRLMTVHSAKGLEFEYVFIVGLEQDLFPHQRLKEGPVSEEEAEEERRLFYVALTRAKKKIFLSYAQIRTIFGEPEIHVPSEFIFDIPEEHLTREYVGANAETGLDDQGKVIEF